MDAQMIMQFVSTLGFPIAVCVYLLWYCNKERESHKEEMEKITEAVNNNTQALITLSERLGK